MYCLTIVDSQYLCSWTVEELRAIIVLPKRPKFQFAEIEDDLHKRIARAMHDKMKKSSMCMRVNGTATRT